MNCPKCGSLLDGNASFCSSCGSSIPNTPTGNNQQTYWNNQPYYGPPKSNTKFKIIIVVLIVLLVCMFWAWGDATDDYYELNKEYNEYQNRDSLDKTIDAIDSWFQ